MEPVLIQGNVRKKLNVKKLYPSEKESNPLPYPAEANAPPVVAQPVGPPFLSPAYPPAGFLPSFLPPWGYVPPQGVVRSGLYPDVSAGVVQDGQPGQTSGQLVGGDVNSGSELPVAGPADQCAFKVDQGVPPGSLTVSMREMQAENVNMREMEAENVNMREMQAENVNMREMQAENVYEDLAEFPKTTKDMEQSVTLFGDHADHGEQDVVEYDDGTPKRRFRKTPYLPPPSSVPGGSSSAVEVRLLDINVVCQIMIFLMRPMEMLIN